MERACKWNKHRSRHCLGQPRKIIALPVFGTKNPRILWECLRDERDASEVEICRRARRKQELRIPLSEYSLLPSFRVGSGLTRGLHCACLCQIAVIQTFRYNSKRQWQADLRASLHKWLDRHLFWNLQMAMTPYVTMITDRPTHNQISHNELGWWVIIFQRRVGCFILESWILYFLYDHWYIWM